VTFDKVLRQKEKILTLNLANMKKTIFALLVATTFAVTSHAQLIDKGALMAGGTLVFNTNKDNKTFVLNPTLGYFFADNLVLGASVSYSSVSKLNAFSVGPFARYYTNFGLFAHTGLNFRHQKNVENENDLDFLIGLGYAAFLNDNVALEPVFTLHLLDGDTYTQLGISLQIYFGR
jgi:hypothetical protein